jgi:hypothetical protein
MEQFAFVREKDGETKIVAVNASDKKSHICINQHELMANGQKTQWKDLLSGEVFSVSGGQLEITIHPSWIRILE